MRLLAVACVFWYTSSGALGQLALPGSLLQLYNLKIWYEYQCFAHNIFKIASTEPLMSTVAIYETRDGNGRGEVETVHRIEEHFVVGPNRDPDDVSKKTIKVWYSSTHNFAPNAGWYGCCKGVWDGYVHLGVNHRFAKLTNERFFMECQQKGETGPWCSDEILEDLGNPLPSSQCWPTADPNHHGIRW